MSESVRAEEPPAWEPVRRVTVSDEVADRLIAGIVGGRFKLGERLPAERDLARSLDVGRPAVREAIRTLKVLGLVDVRRGEGTFITGDHGQFVARAFGWAILLDSHSAAEVVEVRLAIEGDLARLAAERATSEDVDALKALLAQMKNSTGRSDEFSAIDIAFHLRIARVARNRALEQLLTAIQSLLDRWIRRALAYHGTLETALDHHEAVVAAIERHDPDAASTAMRTHIAAMGRLILDSSPFTPLQAAAQDRGS
jgi:GntR family transcriptional repressor for pyruvate dehydrogenase complex